MRKICIAACAALLLGASGCAQQPAPTESAPADQNGTRFEVTPGVAVATGATVFDPGLFRDVKAISRPDGGIARRSGSCRKIGREPPRFHWRRDRGTQDVG